MRNSIFQYLLYLCSLKLLTQRQKHTHANTLTQTNRRKTAAHKKNTLRRRPWLSWDRSGGASALRDGSNTNLLPGGRAREARGLAPVGAISESDRAAGGGQNVAPAIKLLRAAARRLEGSGGVEKGFGKEALFGGQGTDHQGTGVHTY